MKLAEALALRSDAQKRYEQLRTRAQANARYQEGEEPAEDTGDLLSQAEQSLDEIETLIRRINHTNASASLGDGTLTDAIAQRDTLRQRHRLLVGVANSAAGNNEDRAFGFRQLRSELRQVTTVPVPEIRQRADQIARQLRELDLRIQQRNWEIELIG